MEPFEINSLPVRIGPRPTTSRVPPHTQLSQCAPPHLVQELIRRAFALPLVQQKQSRFASPETIALWIPDEYARGPATAFIDDHEFCHIHRAEGMIHATFPDPIRRLVTDRAWGEWHAIAEAGMIASAIVVIYAPRDQKELDVVCELVRISHEFACGISALQRRTQ